MKNVTTVLKATNVQTSSEALLVLFPADADHVVQFQDPEEAKNLVSSLIFL